ncbi:MAG: molybdopterin biosynthesis protein, partial [Oscillospiraceae bacterium]|nr:molybdopterin biosynthesis protein [Oscillospiraceae bacterium]
FVNDKLIATPLSRGSGVVTSFMKADGIVDIPQGVEGFESGEAVRVRLLRSKDQISRSIVAIGSHDPLLDELTELLQRATNGQISLGSSHVGSMGGIMAVRRGEVHIAATHLLDEKTGEYNIPFIQRYFPNGGIRLVECVKRTQGLILQKGNPKNITDISGLKQEGLRYVNRQKGSGTRVLLDYLCKNEGVDTSGIYGYGREEYTHTAVAALIAADSADAGLGIYSVSKLYDLDFVPVCDEQYDLLIPDYAWDSPSVQAFLEVLKSSAFRQKLDDLGGYTVENPGTVIFQS